MGLKQFIEKYNGKFVEYHSYGTGALNQCTDLVNQYIVEVLSFPAIIGTNAQDFPTKASKTHYDWILNTPTGLPLEGDIMIFKSSDNIGHISIFVEGNLNLFTSFDQNYPTGSPCKLVSHNYRNVIGWLHPKKDKTMEIDEKTFNKLVRNSDQWDSLVKYLIPEADPNTTSAEQLKSVVAGIKSRATDMENKLAEANTEVKNRIEQIGRKEGEIAEIQKLLKVAEATVLNCSKTSDKLITEYKEQLKGKQGELDDYAKKLGLANIALAEALAKRDYFSVIKWNDLELIKWK